MTILDRMAAALVTVERHWTGKRKPKAFYLAAADWAEFEATDPPSGRFLFGNNPPDWRVDLTFEGVPVRPSDGATSRLYDHTTTGRAIPVDPNAPTPAPSPDGLSDIPAAEVFAALDQISRTRALTEGESTALEAAMKGRVVLTKREAARLGIKRKAAP